MIGTGRRWVIEGRAWWLSSKMGYSRHGFWCPPREDDKDGDVSHSVPHTGFQQLLPLSRVPISPASGWYQKGHQLLWSRVSREPEYSILPRGQQGQPGSPTRLKGEGKGLLL